jgi:hypothetical protein
MENGKPTTDNAKWIGLNRRQRGDCWPVQRSRMHSTPDAAAGNHSSMSRRGWFLNSPLLRGRATKPVLSAIEARIIECPVNLNPVGLVDAAAIAACGADGVGAGHLQPAALFPRNGADLFGHLG